MILEDFVMLGTTVPEPRSDGRVFVCSAGVSAERRSLIRVYPLARRHAPHRWSVNRVQLELNPQDPRTESYAIAGDRSQAVHADINLRFEEVCKSLAKSQRSALLEAYFIPSIQDANRRHKSLALIRPKFAELHLEDNARSGVTPELTLFDQGEPDVNVGAKAFKWMPRIAFTDEAGDHDLMLRDWGTFELQRKYGPDYFAENAESALHLAGDSPLLVGNMLAHQTSWLVIAVLNDARSEATLF